MAKTSNVIEFLVKGGKAAVRQFKLQTNAMKGYVKNLKILTLEKQLALFLK